MVNSYLIRGILRKKPYYSLISRSFYVKGGEKLYKKKRKEKKKKRGEKSHTGKGKRGRIQILRSYHAALAYIEHRTPTVNSLFGQRRPENRQGTMIELVFSSLFLISLTMDLSAVSLSTEIGF